MPIFKQKNTKKLSVNKNSITTLDSKHTELTEEFENDLKIILPRLKNEKKIINTKLLNTNLLIDERIDLQEHLNIINKNIKDIKLKKKQYYLQNSKYIFDYFENKKQITNCTTQTKKIACFFNIKSHDNINNITSINNLNVQKYLNNVDEGFFDINNYIIQKDICNYCQNGELVSIDNEGILVCTNIACGKTIKYLVENEKPSYKEPPKEVCFYAYKRINHFREILSQFQAKETTKIDDSILENIKHQIKKERITIKDITNKKMKEILKKLEYNKYYEHIPYINEKIGIKPPVMSSDLESLLSNLFTDIQGPYAKHCPEDRINFLNYYYTVYKLCELLNEDEFLPYFQLLKDREKMIEQDEIWKKICRELNWEFISTV